MNRPTTDNLPPLAFDDPRISEWIDDRLTGADADAVARAVAASPRLARFVEELRAVKAAAAAVETAPPPEGFVGAVMAAVTRGRPATGGDDAAVDTEWRKLEAERIAEERAEAREDVVEAEPLRPRWTWLAMAASLAAGVLVAVGLNGLLTQPARREVAQAPALEQAPAAAPSAGSVAVNRLQERPLEDRAVEPLTEEIEIVVEGPEGREELARLLVETGLERKDAESDDEPIDREGFTAGAVTLDDDRLVVMAEPEAIESFKAALAARSRGRVRLHARAEPLVTGRQADGLAAKAAAPQALRKARGTGQNVDGQAADEQAATPDAGEARPPLRRLLVKIVGDDEPAEASAAGPAPGAIEE